MKYLRDRESRGGIQLARLQENQGIINKTCSIRSPQHIVTGAESSIQRLVENEFRSQNRGDDVEKRQTEEDEEDDDP